MSRSRPAEPTGAPPAPTVSVVMPTRNRAALLPEAVATVLAQDGVALELVVVDDASTDETLDVLRDLVRRDARVRFVRLDRRGGPSRARNAGIAETDAPYVAFIDDDTAWHPSKLRRQLDAAARDPDGIGMVYGPYLHVYPDGTVRRVGSGAAAGADPFRALLRRNFIGTPTVLVRRDLLEAVGGFDEALPRHEDWDLFVRLAELTRFAYVPEPLTRCRYIPGGVSTQAGALVTAVDALVRKMEARGLPRALLADWCTAQAHALMIGGAPAEGAKLHLRAARLAPWPPHRLPLAVLAACGERVYGAAIRTAVAAIGWLRGREAGEEPGEASWSTS